MSIGKEYNNVLWAGNPVFSFLLVCWSMKI